MARVLVVEDNAPNLELMTYLLEALGHAVIAARDGEAGVVAAQRESPDIIVCDVHIPKLSGYEVAARLKQHPALRAIPLVAVTALAMVGDRDKVLAAGFDGYIPKPIEPETFGGRVEAFLAPARRAPKPAGPAPEAAAPVALPAPTGARILVVDDSGINLEVLASTLAPLGYDVAACRSVDDALASARRRRPDLIISDVHMRGRDGFEFIRAVKDDPALRSVPFMFLSSTVWEEADRRTGLALGAVKFVQRPTDPQHLIAEVVTCLHARPRDSAVREDDTDG